MRKLFRKGSELSWGYIIVAILVLAFLIWGLLFSNTIRNALDNAKDSFFNMFR